MSEIKLSQIGETPQPLDADGKPETTAKGLSRDARDVPARTQPLHFKAVSMHPAHQSEHEHLELSVEELFRRARPLPDHDEMVIEDLSEDEGEAFLAAVES
jgi:hypothetical protein